MIIVNSSKIDYICRVASNYLPDNGDILFEFVNGEMLIHLADYSNVCITSITCESAFFEEFNPSVTKIALPLSCLSTIVKYSDKDSSVKLYSDAKLKGVVCAEFSNGKISYTSKFNQIAEAQIRTVRRPTGEFYDRCKQFWNVFNIPKDDLVSVIKSMYVSKTNPNSRISMSIRGDTLNMICGGYDDFEAGGKLSADLPIYRVETEKPEGVEIPPDVDVGFGKAYLDFLTTELPYGTDDFVRVYIGTHKPMRLNYLTFDETCEVEFLLAPVIPSSE